MVEVRYSPATDDDVLQLNSRMRAQDRDEMHASNGPDTLATLRRAVALSDQPVACHDVYGRLWCVFGAVPRTLGSSVALIWLIGTDALAENYDVLARDGRRYIDQALLNYSKLENWVDARNRWSLVWLRRMGFTIDPPEPYGVEQRMFHHFYREAE